MREYWLQRGRERVLTHNTLSAHNQHSLDSARKAASSTYGIAHSAPVEEEEGESKRERC